MADQMPTTEMSETEQNPSNQVAPDNTYANVGLARARPVHTVLTNSALARPAKGRLQQEETNLEQIHHHAIYTYLEWCKNDKQRGVAASRTQPGSMQVLLALEPDNLSQIGHLIELDTNCAAILERFNSLMKQEYSQLRKIDSICDAVKSKVEGNENGKDDYQIAEEVKSFVRARKDVLDITAKKFLETAVASR